LPGYVHNCVLCVPGLPFLPLLAFQLVASAGLLLPAGAESIQELHTQKIPRHPSGRSTPDETAARRPAHAGGRPRRAGTRRATGRRGTKGSMAIVRSNRRVAEARLRSIAGELLEASTLCAISTVATGGRAHVNTAYFAWAPDLRVIWLSEPRAQHSRNVRANASAAVAVYDSNQSWGKPDRGIQLFGAAREAAPDAEDIYAVRFPDFRAPNFGAYRLYELFPRRLKLFDELALGAATFVTARVGRDGRLSWERTEIYDPEG
jgi:uncharacterized protein YhbP (UPF0306 family)